MKSNLKVLIVGAGRFAANYIQVLDELNRSRRAKGHEPLAGTLILTRRGLEAARNQARRIIDEGCRSFNRVYGARVGNLADLETLLEQQRPDVTCITARDPGVGDHIHALYAPAALAFGPVLCEKPFDVAVGDGSSLNLLKELLRHPNAGQLGLHLPMAVVRDAMLADARLGPWLAKARELEFLWEKTGDSQDLASDLGLHPWSLIPPGAPLQVTSVESGRHHLRIDFSRRPPGARALGRGRIVLQTGGRFRGMRIDSDVFSFIFDQGRLHVCRHAGTWGRMISDADAHAGDTDIVLSVDNPLGRHLVAALRGRPLVGVKQIYAAQFFLETVKGWRPRAAERSR